jgi:hypothetical protein
MLSELNTQRARNVLAVVIVDAEKILEEVFTAQILEY